MEMAIKRKSSKAC